MTEHSPSWSGTSDGHEAIEAAIGEVAETSECLIALLYRETALVKAGRYGEACALKDEKQVLVRRLTERAPALLGAGRTAVLATDGGEKLAETLRRLLVALDADMTELHRTMLATDRLVRVIRDAACGSEPTHYGPGAKVGAATLSAIAVNDVL